MQPVRVAPILAILVFGCGAPPSPTIAPGVSAPASTATPTIEAIESPSDGVKELLGGNQPLAPGRYTRSGFQPMVTFVLDEGWFAGAALVVFPIWLVIARRRVLAT